MSVGYGVVFASCLLGVVGCESDAEKLARLDQERTTECLLEQAYHVKAMTARFGRGGMTPANMKTPLTPEAESLARIFREHRAKCEIANRDYNRLVH